MISQILLMTCLFIIIIVGFWEQGGPIELRLSIAIVFIVMLIIAILVYLYKSNIRNILLNKLEEKHVLEKIYIALAGCLVAMEVVRCL